MAFYTSVEKLLSTMPAIGSMSTVDSACIANFINAAESIVNGKIATTYDVPVATASPLLETLATDLSLYRFLLQRVYATNLIALRETDWPARYKEALDMLDKLAAGDMSLTDEAGAIIPQHEEDTPGVPRLWYSNRGMVPTFADVSFTHQRVDPEKDVEHDADMGVIGP